MAISVIGWLQTGQCGAGALAAPFVFCRVARRIVRGPMIDAAGLPAKNAGAEHAVD